MEITNSDVLAKRSHNPVVQLLDQHGLYHSFRLPDGGLLRGALSIELQEQRLASLQLPADLQGKRLLDIGPWDGYFTFEAERRGARVTAIDYVDLDTFRELHRYFGSKADYLDLNVYQLDANEHGTYDIVLCLGVLYHLKHPLFALEKICAVTRELCLIDTFVVDAEAWTAGHRPPIPYAEFYERGELAGQLDNWSGPTVSAVEAWARAAGFAQVEVLAIAGTTARVAAYRQWRNLPPVDQPAIQLLSVNAHAHRGKCFDSKRENYLSLWCSWQADAPPLSAVYAEIDQFGVPALSATPTGNVLLVNLTVPPGLAPGEHHVRLRIGSADWSNCLSFYVDLPPLSNGLELLALQDGVTWELNTANWSTGAWMTVWVRGLSQEADTGNTIVDVGGVPHFPEAVFPGTGQINLRLRPVIHAGEHHVKIRHRGATSQPQQLTVTGDPPAIHGLEGLYKR